MQSITISKETRAILISTVASWLITCFGVFVLRDYSFPLFVMLPVIMGAGAVSLYAYQADKLYWSDCRYVAFMTLFFYSLGLLVFAIEGIICLFMAAPIGIFLTWVGAKIAFAIAQKSAPNSPLIPVLLFLSVPASMAFKAEFDAEPNTRAVVTKVRIAASPEVIWQNVIAFPQLAEPTELLFKTGIAYPINAQIEGDGVGAVRHCNFSTGSFVEPITAWEEPHLLQFDVTEQPEPMREISFYDIHPPHLHGFLVSQKGQFKLTQMPDGTTELEGTTWYFNRLEPGFYWNAWSDYIIHSIHERVLNHIKTQSEKR